MDKIRFKYVCVCFVGQKKKIRQRRNGVKGGTWSHWDFSLYKILLKYNHKNEEYKIQIAVKSLLDEMNQFYKD